MKIVIAPQAFKGSMDATRVAEAIARGVRQIYPEAQLVLLPLADGGEGTVQAMVRALGGKLITERVLGPLQRPVEATWGLLRDGVGVIEMAAASGLPLVRREERDPLVTTSFGTGQLIEAALDRGVRHLIIGLGGSATNDGGAGMARALGVHFLDRAGRELPLGGGALVHLARIDISRLDPRVAELRVEIASDVNNPLLGPIGATAVYAAQKGAGPEAAGLLEEGLARLATVIEWDLGIDVRDIPGAGAAGGMGAGLVAFLHAVILPGVNVIFSAMRVDEWLRGADLVITGEGRMDSQDIYGKAPVAIAERAKAQGIPSIAVVGSTGRDYHVVYEHGMDAVIGIVNRPMTLERAVQQTGKLITEAASRAMRLVRVGRIIERRHP